MQSRNFRLQKVGDINWLERNYKFQSIAENLDEIIVLNASRKEENKSEFAKTVTRLVENVFLPVSAGGRIKNIEDAALLFKSGADKIVLNSLLHESRIAVIDLINLYGSQSVIASIDCKLNENGGYEIYTNNGSKKINKMVDDYIIYLQDIGVGEIYLNSIDKDGTGFGYDLNLVNQIDSITQLPLIIAGGAGNENHLAEGLNIQNVSAVATANLFNFVGDGLPKARKFLLNSGFNLAKY